MRGKPIWFLLAAAALSVPPFLPGLHHAFVYDDHGVIVENPYVQDPANLAPVLSLRTVGDPSVIDGGRPAVTAGYIIDAAVWGLNPAGFRLTNYLLHAAAAGLLFALVLRLTGGAAGPAFACALLFAWHPLNVEPVHAPAFREDTLCLVAGLAFLLLGTSRSRRAAAAAPVMLAVALGSKESALMFPAALLALYIFFPALRPGRRAAAVLLTVSACMSAAWAWLSFGGRSAQALGTAWNGLSFQDGEILWSLPLAAFWYLRMWIAPLGLSVDYVVKPLSGPDGPVFWIGAAVIAFAVALMIATARRRPLTAFAVCWVALFFAPVSNLVQLFNPVADRYAYALLPGFSLLAVSLAPAAGIRGRRAALLLAAVLAVYGALTVRRVADWKDDRTLWTAALNTVPASSRAHTWLGLIEKADGNRQAAWSLFSEAEELNPSDPSPSINKAVLVGEMGDAAGAEARLREVLERHPGHVAARRNLAFALRLQGRDAEANAVDPRTSQP